MLVLIPAYQPDLRLVQVVRDLGVHLPEAQVLIVDDGSGPTYEGVFQVAMEAGARILHLPTNRGKGAALKCGFSWAREHAPGEPVVCADCDGQHAAADIAAVAAAIAPGTMVLGGRRFTGRVPLRSRIGNVVSRRLFRAVTGLALHDTQTGLRAYPADVLPWLGTVDGDRFEYEFRLLLAARNAGVAIQEVPIATIYLNENTSSHFRPVRDSLRIYAPVVRFAVSSLIGYVIDLVALLGLMGWTGHLETSVVGARLLSASVNFTLNRRCVFGYRGPTGPAALRYAAVAVALLAANLVLMAALVTAWGLPLLWAKITVEAGLFVVSYAVQHRAVFPGRPRPTSTPIAVQSM